MITMRRFLRVQHLVTVTAVAAVLVVLLTEDELPCSPAAPCTPQPAKWLLLGALLAPAAMAYAHRWAAAWAATATALCWAVLEPGPAWWALPPWVLVLVTMLAARRRRSPVDAGAAPGRRSAVEVAHGRRVTVDGARRQPPAPHAFPRVGVPTLALGAAMLLAAGVTGVVVFWRQAAVDRQQDAARIVTGVVEAHPGESAVRVAVPGRDPVMPDVLDSSAYPVGTEVELLVDDGGLAQLRGEPYDLSPWLAVAMIGLGTGIALLARAAQRRRGLRALFAVPQPVRDVRVVDQLGYVHVLVPAADGRTAVEFGINTADAYSSIGGADDETETLPALLYGEPRRGGWCAVEVAGRLHVPVEPVGDTTEVPYDADHGLPREVSDDEEQLVDPEALIDADRTAAPDQPREHRVAPGRAWFTTVVIGLGAALATAELMHLAGVRGWAAAAVVAVVAAAGYEFGWRHQLRPRLRWHAGGVAAVGFRSRVREPWTVDSAAVHDDEGTVILTAGDSVLTVAAPRPWPSWVSQRTPDQLVAALRLARMRAFAGRPLPAVPEITAPARPAVLYLAWAVTVAAALALLA
jgi:hypothetical protein